MMRALWPLLTALLAACLTSSAWAEPPVDVAPKPAAKKPAAKPAARAKAPVRPTWAELTAEQQMILAPLLADWECIETERRQKWIGIAKRYPRMRAEEQERVQRRMQTWAKLSPEQRRQARETYKQIVKVPPEKRGKLREHWAEYQLLPEHEREPVTPESRRKK
jgi:hypothetical protein